MKVQIEGNFYIESEDKDFVLKEYTGKVGKPEKGKMEGKPLFKRHGYYTDIQGAAKKFLQLKIKESTASDLRELITEVAEIKAYIKSVLDY